MIRFLSLLSLPVLAIIVALAHIYQTWHTTGRRGSFLDDVRSNAFPLVTLFVSLLMLLLMRYTE